MNYLEDYINFYNTGSKIKIKKKNRGKFTKSAQAAGESVQEHAHKVMNDPNATPLQRKRANFAIQAKKWHKHFEGGVIKAAAGTELPFIGLRRQINPAAISESEKEYQEKVKKILTETKPEVPELNIPEEQQVETKQGNTPTEKTDWTTGYRIGEETSETTPATTKITATTVKPDMSKVRSDRNNNPLNIRFTNIAWQGKKTKGKSDNDFEEFESRDYGWRAAYKNIETKMNRGLNTITKLVSEWAPPTENNTNGYIQFVASKTGIDPNAVLTREDLPKIGAAMAAVESGRRDNIDWDDAARGFKFYLG